MSVNRNAEFEAGKDEANKRVSKVIRSGEALAGILQNARRSGSQEYLSFRHRDTEFLLGYMNSMLNCICANPMRSPQLTQYFVDFVCGLFEEFKNSMRDRIQLLEEDLNCYSEKINDLRKTNDDIIDQLNASKESFQIYRESMKERGGSEAVAKAMKSELEKKQSELDTAKETIKKKDVEIAELKRQLLQQCRPLSSPPSLPAVEPKGFLATTGRERSSANTPARPTEPVLRGSIPPSSTLTPAKLAQQPSFLSELNEAARAETRSQWEQLMNPVHYVPVSISKGDGSPYILSKVEKRSTLIAIHINDREAVIAPNFCAGPVGDGQDVQKLFVLHEGSGGKGYRLTRLALASTISSSSGQYEVIAENKGEIWAD